MRYPIDPFGKSAREQSWFAMIETDPVPEPEYPDFNWPPPVTDSDVLWLQAPEVSPRKTAIDRPATAWVESQPAIVDISQPAIVDIARPAIVDIARPAIVDIARPAIVAIESHQFASSPAPTIPLSRVFSGQIPYGWQEVVAVVRQLADQLSDESESAPTSALPELSRIALESTGRLRVRLAPNGLQPVARGLALMLHRLLTGRDGPLPLRLAVSQIVSGAVPIRSVSELSRELARLDAPRDPERLLALYQRAECALATEAVPVRPPPSPDAQARPDVPPPAADADDDDDNDDNQLRTFRASPRHVLMASVLAVAAVLVGAAWFVILTSHPEGGQSPADLRPSDVAQDNEGRSLNELRPSQNVPHASRHQASRAEDAGLVSKGTLKTGGTSGVTISSAPRPKASRTQIEQSTVALNRPTAAPSQDGDLQPTIPAATRTTSASRAAVTVDDRVYTSADEGVTQPVRLGPPLPDRFEPGGTGNTLGVLELVIDPRGVVESAHLRSPGNRYRERWLVYAAKTWRFQPAVKDGQPVRFLERMAITETGPSEPQ